MIRLLIIGLLIYLGYRLIRNFIGSAESSQNVDGNGGPREAELIQDPQCGAYFLRQRGVKAEIEGRTVYFCGQDCLNAYIAHLKNGRKGDDRRGEERVS